MSAKANYRVMPEGQYIKQEDYRFGFGLDNNLCNRIHQERLKRGLPTRDNYKEDWDTRSGENIEGKPFHTRHHPFHDLKLIERETGKRYIVDSVHKQHYMGYYMVLLVREEGTKSHGIAYWKNISCHEPNILEGIKEAHERFWTEEEMLAEERKKVKKFPHNIHFFELNQWGETHSSISRDVLSPSYTNFKDGDIYFRFNGTKVNCKQMNGESNKFYDSSFGMGTETHYGKTINVNFLIETLYKDYYDTYVELINVLNSRGFKITLVDRP
jgi:hypothetical protein